MSDQPFEELDEPVSEDINGALCTGVMAGAATVEWPVGSGTDEPCLIFQFANHEGKLLPAIVFIGDDDVLDGVAELVADAVTSAKAQRGKPALRVEKAD